MHKRRIQRCGVRQAVGNRATCRTGMPSGTRSVCSSPSRRNFTSKLRVPPVGAAIDIGATSAPCSKSSSGTTRKVGRTEHAMMSTPGSCTELAGGGVKRNRWAPPKRRQALMTRDHSGHLMQAVPPGATAQAAKRLSPRDPPRPRELSDSERPSVSCALACTRRVQCMGRVKSHARSYIL